MVSDPRLKDWLIVFLALLVGGTSAFSWYRSATVGDELVSRAITTSERFVELRKLVQENNRMSLFFRHDVAALCRATQAQCSGETMNLVNSAKECPP